MVEPSVGKEFKEYVEKRLSTLEEGGMRSLTKGISRPQQGKYEKPQASKGEGSYNKDADVVEEAPKKKKKRDAAAEEEEVAEEQPKKKKKKVAAAEEEEAVEDAPKEKKKKKKQPEE